MKSITHFIFLSTILLFISCTKKDNSKTPPLYQSQEKNSAIEVKENSLSISPKELGETPEIKEAGFELALNEPPNLSSELSVINPFSVDPASEILSKRDRTTKHYLRKDGKTIDAVLSPKSVHYINGDNEWEDINTKIVPAEGNSYAYTNQTNNLKSWFPADISQKGVKIVTEEGKLLLGENLRMNWSGVGGELIKSEKFKSPDLQVSQNKIVYKNVLPDVHNEYVVQADKLKHNIILEEKPLIPEDAEYLLFSEEVVLPENWSIDFDEELKGLVILKANKEIYLEVPFPDIYEANNRAVTTDERTSGFDLIQLSSNKYQINTRISQEWLQERNFPVIVDPTIVLNGASSGYMINKYRYTRVSRNSYCGSSSTNVDDNYYAYNNTAARVALNYAYYSQVTSNDCRYGWYSYYSKTVTRSYRDYYRGWINYNTNTIPDTGIINSVEFSANVSGGYMGGITTNINLSSSPGPYSNNSQSFYSMVNGGYLGNAVYSDAGQYPYVVLDASSHVQNLLSEDYFQIGLYSQYFNESAQIKTFDTNASLLRITYQECVPPVAAGKDISVQLDTEGNATISTADVDDGSTADCGLESFNLSKDSFTCEDLGDNPVTLTVTDTNGETSSYDLVVTVEDNVVPAAIAQDITVQLDASGAATITAADIDNGSNDACGIANRELDITSFDCTNIGANTVTLTVTDNNNNVSTATATVTVEDNVAPAAIAQDITVQLDASGAATITPADIDNGSNEACGIANLELDVTSFNCTNIGANTVTLTVTDNNNNVSTATATVTVEDNVAPAAIAQDITVQLDASGAATITAADIDNGSNDACGIASLALSKTDFDCTNIGANTVTLTVIDNNNNVSTATATVTVEGNVAPTAIAQDITVQLDALGAATITPADIDNGSNDACGIADLALDVTSFDCTNIGANTVTLTVTDNNNNISTATATVTVEDNVAPAAIAQDITVQLDASGAATITAADIDNGSNDACELAGLTLDVTSFDCTNIGVNTVTLTVTDNNNNVSTATATVTIEDNVAPAAIAQDITVQLDASGAATITAADIDNGSNDACGIADLALDVTSFDCTNIGANTVTLSVTDNNNNISTATATVTVEDNVAPVAIAQDITVQLSTSGKATVTAEDIDNGSNDACGIAHLTLDVSSFDCTNVGANTVTLTVTDNNNNVSTATATVTVEDNVAPAAIAQDITVQLDASGAATITAADIDNGSNDACGIASLALSKTDFDCTNIGANPVTLTVTDNNNNVSTATAMVTVEDNVAPTAIAQDITVQLDATGAATITAADIDNGSNDACGIANLELDVTSFDCTNIGANTVTLTVTDNNNNVSTATATVTVEDNVAPAAIAKDITVQLDALGAATITPADIDNGSNDACGIADLALDVTSFDCTNIGANTVTLTVTDNNNNISTATATVTVEDNVAPAAIAQDITVQLDASGAATITAADIDNGSNDACGIANLELDVTSFDCTNIGVNTVTLTVTDNNNNVSTATATVTVEDNVAPAAIAQDITVQLDTSGAATITAADIDNGSNDACGIADLALDVNSFDCTNVGANPVTLTVTDNNNNVSTATATVTVEDNVAPAAIAQDITVQLDALGAATITAADIDNGSNDACVLADLTLDVTSFDCTNVGANTVTLSVTDNNNNVSTATATVTVEDNVAPVAIAQDITVQLDASGAATITAADIDNGSNDACGIASLALSKADFDCSNIGPNNVTLTVTDNNGNVSTVDANVEVKDETKPDITCVSSQERYVDPYQTYYTVQGTEFDATATDACGVASLTYSGGIAPTSGDSMNEVKLLLGVNTMTWTAVDVNNNSSNCSTSVTIKKRPTTLTYNGDHSEQYSDQTNLSATLIDNVSGTGIAGKMIKFSIGSQSTSAVTDANGVASTTLILTQDPANSYMVETEFPEDAGYLGSTDSDAFNITRENAMIAYTGQSLQATPSTRDTEAIVILSANIQDITANTSYSLYDAFEGDIRNAKVNFMIVETGENSGWLQVTDLVDPSDSKTGRVSYEWLAQLTGNNTSESFTIRVMVDNGFYIAEDETVVTVYIPTGDFITGGGYLLPDNSAGQYASTPGLKTNFGFNVKYNKKGTQLKGHMNVIFRRLESDGIVHKYQIKSNAVQSLGVDVSDPDAQVATFITKSNLSDITDPDNPISLGGNLILKVNMTDRGEPGTYDSISFDLTDGNSGVLLFSSNWSVILSEEMNLAGGNLLVHSGFSLEGASEDIETSTTETKSTTVLDFTVSPNPSIDYFTVHILTENKRDKINLSVHDYSGSVVYQTTGKPNDTYTFGHNFQAGTYIVRVEQAGEVQKKIVIRDN